MDPQLRRRAGDGGQGLSISESLHDHARAVASGFLIGLPLYYTAEFWWFGTTLHPLRLLAVWVASAIVVAGFTLVSGFRREKSRIELAIDVVQTLGLAIVTTTVALLLLGRLPPDDGLGAAAGRIAMASIPTMFGAALSGTQLAAPDEAPDATGTDAWDQTTVGVWGRLVVAAGGALFLGVAFATNDELVVLAFDADPLLLAALIAVSLVLTFAVVFFAEFRGGVTVRDVDSPLDTPVGETLAAYLVSLGVAGALLIAFRRFENVGPEAMLAQLILLGLPAALGAAVARLLVGGGLPPHHPDRQAALGPVEAGERRRRVARQALRVRAR